MNNIKIRSLAIPCFLVLLVGAILSASVTAQSSPSAVAGGPRGIFTVHDDGGLRKSEYTQPDGDVQSLKLDSKLMGRQIPYRLILPRDYETSKTERYPVIYLIHGLTGNYTNWTDKTKLSLYAAKHRFIIVTPDGANGWYSDSIATPADKYESYIVKELIPEIDNKYRTLTDREHRVIAGLSMGGYGSIKFGFKYPEMFALVGSFSGALGAADFTAKNAGDTGKSIDGIFGPEGSETRNANNIFKMAHELTPEKVKALPYIFQSCGTEDFLFNNNRDFQAILIEKKVPHEYREHPGIHDWVFWDDQVREFLDLAERRIRSNKQ